MGELRRVHVGLGLGLEVGKRISWLVGSMFYGDRCVLCVNVGRVRVVFGGQESVLRDVGDGLDVYGSVLECVHMSS